MVSLAHFPECSFLLVRRFFVVRQNRVQKPPGLNHKADEGV